MKYEVAITEEAWDEIQEAYDWLVHRAPEAARRWKSDLLEAIQELETLPAACSLAPETAYFGREVRQMLYGKRRNKYRVLFEIRKQLVIVLRVRHGARRNLGEE
jgi:plasmid stabilization system protein ParE